MGTAWLLSDCIASSVSVTVSVRAAMGSCVPLPWCLAAAVGSAAHSLLISLNMGQGHNSRF